jgi:hypothetical protein
LTNVAHWIQAGRIELFETPVERIYSPANYELLATWFTVFLHHDLVVEAAGLPAYLMGFASVYCIGRTLGTSRSAAWVGALAYASTPAWLIAATGTKNDPHVAGYFLAALALAVDLSARRSTGRAANSLGGILSMVLALLLAAGTKAYIAHILPGLILIAALHQPGWRSLQLWRNHLSEAVRQLRQETIWVQTGLGLLLCGGLLLGGYWNIRNWILTGNPFYPYEVTVEGAPIFRAGDRTARLELARLFGNLETGEQVRRQARPNSPRPPQHHRMGLGCIQCRAAGRPVGPDPAKAAPRVVGRFSRFAPGRHALQPTQPLEHALRDLVSRAVLPGPGDPLG